MNLFKKYFSLLILSFLLTSCAASNLEQLSEKENFLKSRYDYNAYLSLEYLQFSRNLFAEKSKSDAQYFAAKGLELSLNEEYIPENPIEWDADRFQMEELVAMQKRLELVLEPRIKNNMPIQMAHLSYLYDCWAAKESQPIFRAAELATCREKFYKLLGEIEYYIDDLRKDKTPKTIIIEPKFQRFEILFDFNNANINDKASGMLITTLQYLASLQGNYRLLLVGNTDRSGSKLYNQNLAFKRTQIVKNYLTKNGVSAKSIEFRSFGEEFPDILTRDGMKQQRNRSVGIYVLTGADSFNPYPLPLIENFIYKKAVKERRVKRGLAN